jgi:hypothetical protein
MRSDAADAADYSGPPPAAVDAAAHASLPPAPASAPRELTRRVLRRGWLERHVRLWWMLALAVLGVAVYYAAVRTYGWYEEARLIKTGVAVQAEVMSWEKGESAKAPKDKVVNPEDPVQLRYEYQGQPYLPFGVLKGRKEKIYTRRMVPLFIDPANPARWTGRTEPGSLPQELVAVMLLLPGAVVLFALALVTRRGVLRTYREGEAVLGEVVAIGHTASAPFQRLVRCAVHWGSDVRIARVLLPPAKTPPVGSPIWLICAPGRPQFAIPAALFE